MEEIKADEAKTLEASMAELDDIIKKMENESISLEQSFALYKKGIAELKACQDMVDTIEKELIVLEEGDNA